MHAAPASRRAARRSARRSAALSKRFGHRGIGVDGVAVVIGAAGWRAATRHATPPATCGARVAGQVRAGLRASARGRPRSCTSCRRARRARAPTARRALGIGERREDARRRNPPASPSVRIATSSSSTCVCVSSRVATIGAAGAQVLVDLQRRVRAAAARRDEHVGGVEKGRDLFGRPLAGEDRPPSPSPARSACARAASTCSGRPPASTSRASGRDARRRAAPRQTADRAPGRPRTCRCRERPASPARGRARARTRGARPVDRRIARARARSRSAPTGTAGSIPRTSPRSCGQITIDDPRAPDDEALEPREEPRAAAASGCNAKFVSCCGRLECMS